MEWLPVAEAARLIGVSRRTLVGWILAGRFPGRKFPDAFGKWFVLVSDLQGRPKDGDKPAPTRRQCRSHAEAMRRLRDMGL